VASDAMDTLTGADNYFEHFEVGAVIRHQRGKTVTEFDNVVLTHLMMNTAEGHFNEDAMSRSEFGTRITYGGVVASIVLGLASQDTGEQVVEELGVRSMRFVSPVLHGDTLYAYTKVLEKGEPRERDGHQVGEVVFKHWGVNQRDDVVAEVERRALVRCAGPAPDVNLHRPEQ
jgi:itaconyl-CoA hydratase